VDCVHLSLDRLLQQTVADEETGTLRVFGICKGRRILRLAGRFFGVVRNNSRWTKFLRKLWFVKVLIMSIFLARAWSLLRLNASSHPRSPRLLCVPDNFLRTRKLHILLSPHRIRNYVNNIHHAPVRLKVRILSLLTQKVNINRRL
jgi:hypothetical protein